MLSNLHPQIEWKRPPDEMQLGPNEIHLWCADLAAQSFPLEMMQSLLSEEERIRARRFRFPKDQLQFTVARGLLRIMLGRYLNKPPAELCFHYGAQGKPSLLDERGSVHRLRFNLAHSDAVIVYAVSWQQEVGIDVEHIRAETSYETIAEQFFSPTEVAALRALPFTQQPQAFFNCWTRKEAYIKARGEGLSFPLDEFEVSLASQAPVSLHVYNAPQESERWRLYHLTPQPHYVGAIAAEGQRHTFRYYSAQELT